MPDIPTIEFDPAHALKDSLAACAAADVRVNVHLRSGRELAGRRIGKVGDHFVVLQALSERDYYDALIALDAIAAIDAQARF